MRHVSRLLATQLTSAGLGPGVTEEVRRMAEDKDGQVQEEEEEEDPGGAGRISTVVGMTTDGGQEDKAPVKLTPTRLQA